MNLNIEKLTQQNKAAVESMLAVATSALGSAERMANLNLKTGQQFLVDCASASKALLAAKNPQEAVAIAGGLVQPATVKATAYAKSFYEISLEAQSEVQKLFEAQYNEFQKTSARLLDQAVKSAPAGSEAIVASFKEALGKANAALETAKQLTTNFAQTAQSTVTSATQAAVGKSK